MCVCVCGRGPVMLTEQLCSSFTLAGVLGGATPSVSQKLASNCHEGHGGRGLCDVTHRFLQTVYETQDCHHLDDVT